MVRYGFEACRFLVFGYLLLATALAADLAPPATYDGRPIAAIRFEPATQPMAERDVLRLLPLRVGEPLNLAEVREAIKKLYSSGQYSNIEIAMEPAPAGVTVIIHSTDQWFIGPVEVRGDLNLPPNAGQLANATRLQLGNPFEESQVQTAVRGIQRLLQRNGLYLASIVPKIERDTEHQEVALTFQVKAGQRARLALPAVTGDTKIGDSKVASAAKYKGWFRWKPATEENTQSGLGKIRKRYQKDKRLTADVTLQSREFLRAQNRVRPHIEANGGPKIQFHTTGAKISNGDLHKYVPVFDEETVNRDLLVTGARNLRDYFQTQGYFEVQVDFKISNPNPELEDITYVLSLGQRHKLVDVTMEGNRYFRTQDIRDLMYLEPAGFIRLRHGRYSQTFVSRDEDTIATLYHANGFRDVKVTDTIIQDYKGKKGDVGVIFHINEGKQYLVSHLTVNGITLKQKQEILSTLTTKPGEPFSESNVSMDRDYILHTYQGMGYANVDFNWAMKPGPGPHQMSVVYYITEGRPSYVRGVVFYGLHNTRRSLIDPAIHLKPGDPLSWTEMGNMQRNFYNLGVFDKVDMAIQNNSGDTERKWVLYHLTEGRRYNLAVGFGAEVARIGNSSTSLNNPGGSTGFAPRVDLELSRLNLWGLGHSINFKSRYSTLDRQVQLNYLAPRFHNIEGRNISVTGLYDNMRDVLTFTATRLQGSIQLSDQLSKPTTLLMRYSWTDDRVDQSTLKINRELIPLYSQTSHVGAISANWIEDRRDNPTNAHRGIYNSLDLGLAETYFGGNVDYLRFLGRNSYYKTISRNYVLASNTEFGVIHPFNIPSGESASEYVPLPEHFFGGGSTSMRGFPDMQAGPRDLKTGFPIGGNALLFHQTELRFPLIGENIRGVLFEDFGNIFSSLDSISFRVHQNGIQDFNYMVHAAGFGIRYDTPLGPLRLDLAYSINPPTFYGLQGTYQQLINGTATSTVQNISHFQFFFSIGQAF
jgi:outer membrane protein insertion porin family